MVAAGGRHTCYHCRHAYAALHPLHTLTTFAFALRTDGALRVRVVTWIRTHDAHARWRGPRTNTYPPPRCLCYAFRLHTYGFAGSGLPRPHAFVAHLGSPATLYYLRLPVCRAGCVYTSPTFFSVFVLLWSRSFMYTLTTFGDTCPFCAIPLPCCHPHYFPFPPTPHTCVVIVIHGWFMGLGCCAHTPTAPTPPTHTTHTHTTHTPHPYTFPHPHTLPHTSHPTTPTTHTPHTLCAVPLPLLLNMSFLSCRRITYRTADVPSAPLSFYAPSALPLLDAQRAIVMTYYHNAYFARHDHRPFP